jgi:hypothetical protein
LLKPENVYNYNVIVPVGRDAARVAGVKVAPGGRVQRVAEWAARWAEKLELFNVKIFTFSTYQVSYY